jgi:hypothetical protein
MANLSNINGKFVVDTAGNIGVGTLTPRSDANTTNISIQSSGTARLFVNNTGASGKEYAIYSSANGDFGIFDYGAVSARLVINSAGNSTFAGNLSVNGEARVYTGSNLGYWGVDAGNSYVYLGTNSSAYGLSLQTGGIDRVNINDAGNVFISTPITNAFYGLSLTYNNTNTADFTVNQATGQIKIGGVATGYFPTFYAGGSEKMRIDTSGQLNLTSGTYHKLAATFPSTYETVLQIGLQATISAEALSDTITFAHSGTEAVSDYVFKVAGNPKLIIKGTGNVGIGTTSPNYLLELSKTAVAVDTYSGINLQASNYGYTIEGGLTQNIGGELIFSSNSVGTKTPRVKFAANGNVGIGTTGPTKTLQVDGSIGLTTSATDGTKRFHTYPDDYHSWYYKSSVVNSQSADVMTYYQQFLIRHQDSTNVFIIRGNGYVGIGTSSPLYRLTVEGSLDERVYVVTTGGQSAGLFMRSLSGGTQVGTGTIATQNNGDMKFFTGSTSEAERMRITSSGTIFMQGLGGYTSSNADVRYATSSKELYYQTSSKRYKTNILNLENSLDKINKLRPVRYVDINTEEPACGLIAEETVEIIPEVVFTKEIEGFDKPQVEGINYSDLVPFLIKSIQELKAEIELLKNK